MTTSIQLPSKSILDSVKDWMNIAIMRTAGTTSQRLSSIWATATLTTRKSVHTIAAVTRNAPTKPVVNAAST